MQISISLFLFIELSIVAYLDLKTRRIANGWIGLHLLFYLFLSLLFPHIYNLSFSILTYPLILFLGGFSLFVLNLMGGGDVKYLSSFFLLIPVNVHSEFFFFLLKTLIWVGGILFLYHTIVKRKLIWYSLRACSLRFVKEVYGQKTVFIPIVWIAWIWFIWEKREFLYF